MTPIADLLGLQALVEVGLGTLSDRSHPVTGMLFSAYRLGQVRRARKSPLLDHAPQMRRLLGFQRLFWSANIAMLVGTVVGRTRMTPEGALQ